jgi:uncharacterized circularly permuted ATP-grasp superfamily protein
MRIDQDDRSAQSPRPAPWHDYHPDGAGHDELTLPDGGVRPHWQKFLGALDWLGLDEVDRRWAEARDLIRQNGVTYNVYGDPRGNDRLWQLDPIPMLVAAGEWSALEAGLIQRARLLDLLLADLYGRQRVLEAGLVPPELVYGNPAFLHPCQHLRVPGDRFLHLYAADIGRLGDGSFLVLADRTQSPSGAGYALENRIVLARALPDVFRDCRVQRLARFYQSVREMLQGLAPHNRDRPRIRPANARPIQRDGVRARLPRPLSRLHTRRGRRSDGSRQPGLPEAPGRAPAGGRDPPPAGRRFLRPARAAR